MERGQSLLEQAMLAAWGVARRVGECTDPLGPGPLLPRPDDPSKLARSTSFGVALFVNRGAM